jgi:hypothetical protein
MIERLISKYPSFHRLVDKYTQPEYTNTLIEWAYEDPTLNFQLPSCSQSYQWRYVARMSPNNQHSNQLSMGDRFPTTLQREIWFFEHFSQQYFRSSVSRQIPNWPVGFEAENSRQIMDHFLKRARRFVNEGKFPPGSWIYSNLNRETR